MKDYTCPCGQLVITFPRKSTARIEGGYFPNNQHAIVRCRNNKCSGAKRLGYSVEFAKDNEVFHRPGIDGPGGLKRGSSTTRKQTTRKNKDKTGESFSWKFMD